MSKRNLERRGPRSVASVVNCAERLPKSIAPPCLLSYESLSAGSLLRRYKRFLGDALISSSESGSGAGPEQGPGTAALGLAPTVVHVPNTGPMLGLLDKLPIPAAFSLSHNPKRKYAHTLEWVRLSAGAVWVGVHSARANAMALALLRGRSLAGLPAYDAVQQEVRLGADGATRIDFRLVVAGAGAELGVDKTGTSTAGAQRRTSAAVNPLPLADGESKDATDSCDTAVPAVTPAKVVESEPGASPGTNDLPDTTAPGKPPHTTPAIHNGNASTQHWDEAGVGTLDRGARSRFERATGSAPDASSTTDLVAPPPAPATRGAASGALPGVGTGDGADSGPKHTGVGLASCSIPVPADVPSGCFLEVKSVSLAGVTVEGSRLALFPDTPSQRAHRHARELTALARRGGEAALLFLVQRSDCVAFAPCRERDPEYVRLLADAAAAGVRLVAAAVTLDPLSRSVRYCGQIPVVLQYTLHPGDPLIASSSDAADDAVV